MQNGQGIRSKESHYKCRRHMPSYFEVQQFDFTCTSISWTRP